MSGFGPSQHPFFLACEAEGPMKSTVADAKLDISFADDLPDVGMFGFRLPRVSLFSDTKTWSSFSSVLLLHIALACLVCVSPKPLSNGPKPIEVQLVSLQGGGDSTPAGSYEAGGGEQPAAPAPHVATPAKEEPPEREIPVPVKQRVEKIERPAPHPKQRNEVKSVQQLNPQPTETHASLSADSGQAVGAGAGTGPGPGNGSSSEGAAGGKNGLGGTGHSDMAFGSPNGPSFLHKVVPSYPALARRLEKEGTVLLCVTIDERGRPVEVEVLGKAGFGFDEEAVKAIKDSTFVPARKEGKPLTCKALLPIRFVLKKS